MNRDRSWSFRRHRTEGFTLLEALMVVGIVIILIAVALPNLSNMNAAFALDGTARGLSALLQRAHYDAISDTTGYRVLLYPDGSASNANSYKLQRRTPTPPFQMTAPTNTWVDVNDAIALPSGIEMATSAEDIGGGVHAITFDSAGDVIESNGDYISGEVSVTLTNLRGDTRGVYITTTSFVRID